MRPLKAPWLWLALGWLLVAGTCFASLVPGDRLPVPGGQDKMLHIVTYCLLMIWFAGIYRVGRFPFIAGGLLLLGLALEFGQRLVVSRTFDGFDVAANALGIVLGVVLAMTVLGGWCQRVESWFFGKPSRAS